MKITIEKLEELRARISGKMAFKEAYPNGVTLETLCKRCLKEYKFDWASWLIAHLLSPEDAVKLAIYSAELVLHAWEEKYPDDSRPRKSIEAAKAWLDNPTEERYHERETGRKSYQGIKTKNGRSMEEAGLLYRRRTYSTLPIRTVQR